MQNSAQEAPTAKKTPGGKCQPFRYAGEIGVVYSLRAVFRATARFPSLSRGGAAVISCRVACGSQETTSTTFESLRCNRGRQFRREASLRSKISNNVIRVTKIQRFYVSKITFLEVLILCERNEDGGERLDSFVSAKGVGV